MHKVKASDLVSLRKSLAEKQPSVLQQVRDALTPELRDILDTSVASTWLPEEQLCAIYDRLSRALYPNSLYPNVQLGRQMALLSYQGIYRVFLSIPSTTYVIKKAASVWASYHSTGSATMEDVADHRAVLVIRGAARISKCMVDVVAGHIMALAELTGAKDPVVVPDAGDPGALRWAVRWK